MKKSLFMLLLLGVVSFSFAHPPVKEKIINIFTQTFPGAREVVWTEFDNFYEVYFVKDDISCRVYYDFNGNVIKSRRDYAGEKLGAFLTAKLTKRFPGKSISLVTEINSADELFYIATLEDQKQLLQVRCEATGDMTVLEKFSK